MDAFPTCCISTYSHPLSSSITRPMLLSKQRAIDERYSPIGAPVSHTKLIGTNSVSLFSQHILTIRWLLRPEKCGMYSANGLLTTL